MCKMSICHITCTRYIRLPECITEIEKEECRYSSSIQSLYLMRRIYMPRDGGGGMDMRRACQHNHPVRSSDVATSSQRRRVANIEDVHLRLCDSSSRQPKHTSDNHVMTPLGVVTSKYVTLQRGERLCDSVTVCERGPKIMWRHTFHFSTIHNFTFYFIYFIMHNTNLSCNYHLRSCKKLNL